VAEQVEALGVGGHEAVLDAVVDHLHEVARSASAAMEIAELLGAGATGSSRRARSRLQPWCERCEGRLEAAERALVPADHQAEAALETEHPAARAAVEVVDPLRLELSRTPDVVGVVRVPAVDDRVPRLEPARELPHGSLGDLAGREHQPDRSGRLERRDSRRGTPTPALPTSLDGRDGVRRRRVVSEEARAMFAPIR
jgi:hypothetical protein